MNPVERSPLDWRRVAGVIFVVSAFGFLGYIALRNARELRTQDWELRPLLLIASIALNISGLLLGVKVWQLLLKRMGFTVRLMPLARIWFLSGLGRYIPGKIWQFVGAAHLAGAAGVRAGTAVTSLAVHTGIFVIAALIVAVYLLPASLGVTGGLALGTARWVAPAALLLVHPALVDWALGVARRFTGRELAQWSGRWMDGIVLVGLACLVWLVTGLAFFSFVTSLTPLPIEAAAELIGVNALAFVAGYLVFFVPAGLGAKEGALAALLTMYLAAPVAALIAIAARLWTIAAEVLPALLLLRTPPPVPVDSRDRPLPSAPDP